MKKIVHVYSVSLFALFIIGCVSYSDLYDPGYGSYYSSPTSSYSNVSQEYVPPYGKYRCTYSTFPGIYPGTEATWYSDGWTVNGTTYPGGVSGSYSQITGGFPTELEDTGEGNKHALTHERS